MTPATLAILTNREVIAVDQDKAGKQGSQLWKSGDQEIWTRSLMGGDRAVAIFNRAAEPAKVSRPWPELEISQKSKVRDLWQHKPIAVEGTDYSGTIPGHGVVMMRVSH